LELLGAGASRRRAAIASGIDPSTLVKWIRREQARYPESAYRRFLDDVLEAEASARKMRVLQRTDTQLGMSS
jgi:transposase-like protein